MKSNPIVHACFSTFLLLSLSLSGACSSSSTDNAGLGGEEEGLTTTTTISFESAAVGTLSSANYTESGYLIQALGGTNASVYGTQSGYPSHVLINGEYGQAFMLSRSDSTAFSITSFQLGPDPWNEACDVVITGYPVGGATLQQTATCSKSTKSLSIITLNWSNLSKIEINFAGGANNAYGSVDNFIVSTTSGTTDGGTTDGGTTDGGTTDGGTTDGGTTDASAGSCGNGTIDPGESCDGSNLNGSTCLSLGFTSGSLACSSSCHFNTSGCVGALTPLTPTVVTSRTSCVAPCAVDFDATGTAVMNGDYVNADFSWNFDSTNVDSSALHRQTSGFVVAHVFDSPGNYTVTVSVHDLAGNAGTASVPISVSAMTGTTIYVASSGSDGNAGTSMSAPKATLTSALTAAGKSGPVSILLRRGDTFNIASTTYTLQVTGPFLIGAYTDPNHSSTAKPILSSTLSSAPNGSNFLFTIQNSSDLRITDLSLATNQIAGAFTFVSGAVNTLIERVDVAGVGYGSGNATGQNFYVNGGVQTAIVDCNLSSYRGYAVYGASPDHLAVIGTHATNIINGDEGIRIQGGNKENDGNGTGTAKDTYIAENVVTFGNTGSTYESITFRGNDQNGVCIGNHVDRYMSAYPQNSAHPDEAISNVLFEGNVVDEYNDELGGISPITAHHVVVRNNLFVNNATTITVATNSTLGSSWVEAEIYNNTSYFFPAVGTPEYSDYGLDFVSAGSGTTVTVRNNIFAEGGQNASSSVVSGPATFDHNLIYAPHATSSLSSPGTGTGGVIADPKFVSTNPTAADAFALQSGSPAIDTGTATGAYHDFAGTPRPTGTAWDIGAWEYTP